MENDSSIDTGPLSNLHLPKLARWMRKEYFEKIEMLAGPYFDKYEIVGGKSKSGSAVVFPSAEILAHARHQPSVRSCLWLATNYKSRPRTPPTGTQHYTTPAYESIKYYMPFKSRGLSQIVHQTTGLHYGTVPYVPYQLSIPRKIHYCIRAPGTTLFNFLMSKVKN